MRWTRYKPRSQRGVTRAMGVSSTHFPALRIAWQAFNVRSALLKPPCLAPVRRDLVRFFGVANRVGIDVRAERDAFIADEHATPRRARRARAAPFTEASYVVLRLTAERTRHLLRHSGRLCANRGGERIPISHTERLGDQFEALTDGNFETLGSEGRTQRVCHGFCIVKVAHISVLCLNETGCQGLRC
jgi:hypothetical protein